MDTTVLGRPLFGISGCFSDGRLDVSLSEGVREFIVKDRRGTAVARLYGVILADYASDDISIDMHSGEIVCDVRADADACEKIVPNIHGNFVLWTHPPLSQRLYLSESGALPLVFCPTSGRVASSPALMFDREEYYDRFDRARYDRLVKSEIAGAWLPAGMTAHSGVERLMPHFFLDLETWTAQRFWPAARTFSLDVDLETGARICADALGRFISAASTQYGRISPTLTGGFDSRILLAASRPVVDRLDFFTFGSDRSHIDYALTEVLAQKLSLNHTILNPQKADPDQETAWDEAVGHCVKESNRATLPSLALVPNAVISTGLFGENGRNRLCERDARTINDGTLTASDVAGRLGLPSDPLIMEYIQRWFAPLGHLPNSVILDLAFNEIKFGTWAGPQAVAQQALRLEFQPFAQMVVQKIFSKIDPSLRMGNALFHRIGEICWPDAMSVGINAFGDYRDWLMVLRKFANRANVTRLRRYHSRSRRAH